MVFQKINNLMTNDIKKKTVLNNGILLASWINISVHILIIIFQNVKKIYFVVEPQDIECYVFVCII